MSNFRGLYPDHPRYRRTRAGQRLEEWLRARGTTRRDLATALGRDHSAIDNIITGQTRMTTALALDLEAGTGIRAETWLVDDVLYWTPIVRQQRLLTTPSRDD